MKEYIENHNSLMYKLTTDLSFYSAGYEDCAPGYGYGPKYRPYHLIHFVLRGKGRLYINKHVFQISAGDCFLIPAGKISYYEASKTDPWSYAWVNFLGINSQMYLYQLMTATKDKYVLHNLDTEKYRKLILQIMSIQGNPTSRYLLCNSIFLQILAFLFDDVRFQGNNMKKFSAVDEIKFYFDINYTEKIKLQDLAKKFGIHPNYLTRMFHAKYGVSPKQYLMSLRLNKACKLLATTDFSIAIIANSLGFDDQFAFSKCFKKEFALSPTLYRKQKNKVL